MKVLIVGAGTSGLQAASTLLKAGAEVVILEQESEAGGRWNSSCSNFLRGAHPVLSLGLGVAISSLEGIVLAVPVSGNGPTVT